MNPDASSQLERLNALKQSGALTETEFQEAQRRLLASNPELEPPDAQAVAPEVFRPGEAAGGVGESLGASMAQASPPLIRPTTWPAAVVTDAQASDRDALRRAGLRFKRYPVWFVVTLSVLTLGIFATFWVNHWHGIMPKRRTDDPSTARAIGFMFIPLFNLYWAFESRLRLCTRLNEEFIAAGLALRAPNQLVLWWTITNMIPYVGFLSLPVMGAIAAGMLQSQVNALAAFDDEWYRMNGVPGFQVPSESVSG